MHFGFARTSSPDYNFDKEISQDCNVLRPFALHLKDMRIMLQFINFEPPLLPVMRTPHRAFAAYAKSDDDTAGDCDSLMARSVSSLHTPGVEQRYTVTGTFVRSDFHASRPRFSRGNNLLPSWSSR